MYAIYMCYAKEFNIYVYIHTMADFVGAASLSAQDTLDVYMYSRTQNRRNK